MYTPRPAGFTLLEAVISVAMVALLFIVVLNTTQVMIISQNEGGNAVRASGMNQEILARINEELIQSKLSDDADQTKVFFGGSTQTLNNVVVGTNHTTGAPIVLASVTAYSQVSFHLPDLDNPFDSTADDTNWDANAVVYAWDEDAKQVVRTDYRDLDGDGSPDVERIGHGITFFGTYQVTQSGLFHVTVICETTIGGVMGPKTEKAVIRNNICIKPLN